MRRLATAIVVAVLIAVWTTAIGILFVRPLPTIDGDDRVIGLDERAEVLRDTYGVPHIFARNAHDLWFVQGYVTAQDRLWQMDLYRRAAQGRLAEVFGEPALESDRLMRTIGLERAARLDLAVLSDETRAGLEAYMEGVNKFLVQHGESLPVEFTLLGYRPDPWTPMDTLSIAKLQLYDAAGNYPQELLRANIATRLGPDAVATLMPDPADLGVAYDPRAWSMVAPYLSQSSDRPGTLSLRGILSSAADGAGSNCWALAGPKTKTGKPLLAGDPHLPARNPSIWYELALDDGDLHLAGFSIPGVPGVVIGHNDRIAWSFAYAYADTQDLFVERQDPSDPRRYEYQGRMEQATFVREAIKVKGRREYAVVDVAITRHGPIISNALKDQKALLALRWNALEGTKTFDAVLGMSRARDFAQFRAAAADFAGAALSACYADVDGHIGYLLVGRLPDRRGDGRMPVPGWTGEYDWRGLRPASDNAFVLDPKDGVILSANNRSPNGVADAGWYGEWDPGFRYQYLAGKLAAATAADVAGTRELQNDVTSPPVTRLRDTILAARPVSAAGADAQRMIREWDGRLSLDSAAAALYESWLVRMCERTFRDKLGPSLYDDYLTNGRAVFALYLLASNPKSGWFADLGDVERGGRDAIAAKALDDAVRDLNARFGSSDRWRWGDLHTAQFDHPIAVFPLSLVMNIGPVRRPGDGYSPNNGAYSLSTPFKVRSHPSERQIVDLSDVDAALSIISTGQSGQPFSKNWGDQTAMWANGDYKPMPLSRERLGKVEGRLVLRPR